ncbi:MAG: hypothetical protein AAGG75_02860 [Bacteroidota bacterium]
MAALLFLVTSCSKEALITPEVTPHAASTVHETPNDNPHYSSFNGPSTVAKSSSDVEADAVNDAISLQNSEYTVQYTSDFDFDEVQLDSTQYLEYTDTEGDIHELSFKVDHSSYSTDTLEVVYMLEGQNLSGLQLETVQNIIIEDILIN